MKKIHIEKKELEQMINEEIHYVLAENKLAAISDKVFGWLLSAISKQLPQDQIIKAGQNLEKQFGNNFTFNTVFDQLKSLNESNTIKEDTTIELSKEGIADLLVNTVNKVAGINLKAFGGVFIPIIGKLLAQTGSFNLKEDMKVWVITFLSSMAIMALSKLYNQLRAQSE